MTNFVLERIGTGIIVTEFRLYKVDTEYTHVNASGAKTWWLHWATLDTGLKIELLTYWYRWCWPNFIKHEYKLKKLYWSFKWMNRTTDFRHNWARSTWVIPRIYRNQCLVFLYITLQRVNDVQRVIARRGLWFAYLEWITELKSIQKKIILDYK